MVKNTVTRSTRLARIHRLQAVCGLGRSAQPCSAQCAAKLSLCHFFLYLFNLAGLTAYDGRQVCCEHLVAQLFGQDLNSGDASLTEWLGPVNVLFPLRRLFYRKFGRVSLQQS